MKRVVCVLLLCVGFAVSPQRTFKEMSVYQATETEAVLQSKSGDFYVINADGLHEDMRLLCYCKGSGKHLKVLDYYVY